MNTSVILIGTLFVSAVLAYALWLIVGPSIQKKNVRKSISVLWQLVETEQKLTLKVTESGEVFEKALELLGYSGDFDKKMKAVSEKLTNSSAVHSANTLRIHLLNNSAVRPSDAELISAVEAYKTALIDLGM